MTQTDRLGADAPSKDDETPAAPPQTFMEVLIPLANGQLQAQLSEKLQEVAAAVMEHMKPGSLTLTLKLTPLANETNVEISDEVKVKIPEANRPSTLFFGDTKGKLSRRDPRQPELPFQQVPRPGKAG